MSAMNSPPATHSAADTSAAAATGVANLSPTDTDPWRRETLDPADPAAVLAYERALFDAFLPVLKINPLIRDLWDWDDAARRLRTRVPYADQFVALLRDPATGDLLFSIAANLHPERFWQSGAYDFPVPAPAEHACEILITATSRNKTVHGPAVLHRFIHAYFFHELRRRGFRCAYLTSADHLRWLYRRFGARPVDEKTIHGLRRTLFRWELVPVPAKDGSSRMPWHGAATSSSPNQTASPGDGDVAAPPDAPPRHGNVRNP